MISLNLNRAERRLLARSRHNDKPVPFSTPELGAFTISPAQVARAVDLASDGRDDDALVELLGPIRAARARAGLSDAALAVLAHDLVAGTLAAAPEVARPARHV
jgi:hypothetical protein